MDVKLHNRTEVVGDSNVLKLPNENDVDSCGNVGIANSTVKHSGAVAKVSFDARAVYTKNVPCMNEIFERNVRECDSVSILDNENEAENNICKSSHLRENKATSSCSESRDGINGGSGMTFEKSHTAEKSEDSGENIVKECFYPSVVKRYFTSYFNVSLSSGKLDSPMIPNRNDVRILFHSNKICVVTLAPSHAAMVTKAAIRSVSFKVSDKCDRFKNKVSGKRKRGAQWLNPESPLCIVTTDDGSVYTVRPGIRGNLIEVNENLIKYPSLLSDMPETNGYIAIIMIKLHEKEKILESLMEEGDYKEYLKCLKI